MVRACSGGGRKAGKGTAMSIISLSKMLVLEACGLVGGLLQLSTCPRDPLEAGNGQLVQEASPVGSLWVGDKRGQVSYGAGT